MKFKGYEIEIVCANLDSGTNCYGDIYDNIEECKVDHPDDEIIYGYHIEKPGENTPDWFDSLEVALAWINDVTFITRNTYFKKLQEGKENMDQYEILPLNLSKYLLNETTQRIVDANFMEETTDRNGNYMLSGHWLSDMCYLFAEKCELDLVQVDGYSAYAYSDKQMVVFTYCEGDITLTPFINRKLYEKEKADTIRFYNEEENKMTITREEAEKFLKEQGLRQEEIPEVLEAYGGGNYFQKNDLEISQIYDNAEELGDSYVNTLVGTLDHHIEAVLDYEELGNHIADEDDMMMVLETSGRIIRF